MAYLGIAAGGLTVLTGLNGQISLGHGALMAVGAYTTALLLPDREASMPLPLVVLVAVAGDRWSSAAGGRRRGAAARPLPGRRHAGPGRRRARHRALLRGAARRRAGALGACCPTSPSGCSTPRYFLTGSELTRSRYVAYLAWFTLIVTFVLLANLSRGRVGRRWRAVRDDEVAGRARRHRPRPGPGLGVHGQRGCGRRGRGDAGRHGPAGGARAASR